MSEEFRHDYAAYGGYFKGGKAPDPGELPIGTLSGRCLWPDEYYADDSNTYLHIAVTGNPPLQRVFITSGSDWAANYNQEQGRSAIRSGGSWRFNGYTGEDALAELRIASVDGISFPIVKKFFLGRSEYCVYQK